MNPFRPLALFCLGLGLVASGQDYLMVDATAQLSRPVRGRGPFPGSLSPGHSSGFPVRLALSVPNTALGPNGALRVDLVITNLGTETLRLPSSVDQNIGHQRFSLTLWLTSDGIKDQYFRDTASGELAKIAALGISAELNGSRDDPRSFVMLPPNQSLRVHAWSGVQFIPGRQTIIAHAELLHVIGSNSSSSEAVDTADSEPVTTKLLSGGQTAR